jgi:transcriptional regulator with XRE-family HTH domain
MTYKETCRMIVQALVAKRLEKRLSIDAVAKAAGFGSVTLRKYEGAPEKINSAFLLFRWANALGYSLSYESCRPEKDTEEESGTGVQIVPDHAAGSLPKAAGSDL